MGLIDLITKQQSAKDLLNEQAEVNRRIERARNPAPVSQKTPEKKKQKKAEAE